MRAEVEGPLATLRVRVIGPSGVRGVNVGDELDAVQCPARETSVWVRAPNGVGYRLNRGEWAPLEPPPTPRRRARSLDDL